MSYKFGICDEPKLELLKIRLGVYFLKMPVTLSRFHGTVGLFNGTSIMNRSKINNVITSNYGNNTYIECFLISVNKIFLLLSLFSVLFFIKDNGLKSNRQFLVLILFSSTILLIQFVSGDVEVNPGPNRKPNEALSILPLEP